MLAKHLKTANNLEHMTEKLSVYSFSVEAKTQTKSSPTPWFIPGVPAGRRLRLLPPELPGAGLDSAAALLQSSWRLSGS